MCSRVVAFDYTVLMTGNSSESQLRARSIDGQLTNSLYCQQSDCKNKNKILLSLVLLCSLAPSSTGCSNTFLAVKSNRGVRAMRTYCQLCGIGAEYISVAGSSAFYLENLLCTLFLFCCTFVNTADYRYIDECVMYCGGRLISLQLLKVATLRHKKCAEVNKQVGVVLIYV